MRLRVACAGRELFLIIKIMITEDIIDEIVSLAATQIDAALDSGSSHASDMKYLAEFREDLINLLRENKLIQ